MKLLRSELNSEFQDTLFEMSALELPDRGIQFFESKVSCILSSKKTQYGFDVSGLIKVEPEYKCVRCLSRFHHLLELPFRWLLTGEKDFSSEDLIDVVYFSNQSDSIDLTDAVVDIIGLAEPMKPICKKDCLGLCSQCGINLNSESCKCTVSDEVSPWDVLKNLNIEKS